MKFTTTFKPRKGFGSVIKHLERIDGSHAEWGVYAEDGMHPKAQMLYSQLMAIHELRDDGWRRPVFHLSATTDRYVNQYRKLMAKGMEKFITNAAKGRYSHKDTVLKLVAERGAKNAKLIFGNKRFLRANTPSTVSRKGNDKPLIEFGLLKSKVRFKVKRKGEK